MYVLRGCLIPNESNSLSSLLSIIHFCNLYFYKIYILFFFSLYYLYKLRIIIGNLLGLQGVHIIQQHIHILHILLTTCKPILCPSRDNLFESLHSRFATVDFYIIHGSRRLMVGMWHFPHRSQASCSWVECQMSKQLTWLCSQRPVHRIPYPVRQVDSG